MSTAGQKIGRNYYSNSNYMVLIRQIILYAKLPTFRAAKLKGFTVKLFCLRERSTETNLFKRVEICLELSQNYLTALLQLMNISQHRAYSVSLK